MCGRGGFQSYCTGPSGSGRKHRRKRTKDILKYAPFDIDRSVGRECHSICFYVDCIQGAADPILGSCHVKGHCVDRCPSFVKQGDSLSIGPQEESEDGGIPRDAWVK